MKTFRSIKKIGEVGTDERIKCLNSITRSYCITNNQLRRIVDKTKNQAKYITDGPDNDVSSDTEYNNFINNDSD